MPEDAGVLAARVRVAGDRRCGGDVLAGVELLVDQQRQLGRVDVVAELDDLVDGRVLGRDLWSGMGEPSRLAYSGTMPLTSESIDSATRSYVPCRFSSSGIFDPLMLWNSTAG